MSFLEETGDRRDADDHFGLLRFAYPGLHGFIWAARACEVAWKSPAVFSQHILPGTIAPQAFRISPIPCNYTQTLLDG